MTPVAAYYIYIATEHERAAHESELRSPRPSLLERLRAIAAALRPKPPVGRPA